jgi:hypothetical protein
MKQKTGSACAGADMHDHPDPDRARDRESPRQLPLRPTGSNRAGGEWSDGKVLSLPRVSDNGWDAELNWVVMAEVIPQERIMGQVASEAQSGR